MKCLLHSIGAVVFLFQSVLTGLLACASYDLEYPVFGCVFFIGAIVGAFQIAGQLLAAKEAYNE